MAIIFITREDKRPEPPVGGPQQSQDHSPGAQTLTAQSIHLSAAKGGLTASNTTHQGPLS